MNPGRISDTAYHLVLAIAVFALSLAVSSNHFHTIDEGSMFVTAVNIGELFPRSASRAPFCSSARCSLR